LLGSVILGCVFWAVQFVLELFVEAKCLSPDVEFVARFLSFFFVRAEIKMHIDVGHGQSLRRAWRQVKVAWHLLWLRRRRFTVAAWTRRRLHPKDRDELLLSLGKRILTDFTPSRWRIFSAWCCLAAAVLLLAPLAQAAWSAHAAACCTKDHCPIPQHHHSKSPEETADCDHESVGITPCSMSCCEKSDHALLTTGVFVMTKAVSFTNSVRQVAAVTLTQTKNLPSSLEVLSPPPRS
jgi:hypothetical protein